MPELERKVEFQAAYDKRDLDPKKNYGICGAVIQFALIGELGTISVTVLTPFFLPEVQKEVECTLLEKIQDGTYLKHSPFHILRPMAESVVYHSKKPIYDPHRTDCALLGGECWFESSQTEGNEFLEILIERGGDGAWEYLESIYREQFEAVDG